MTDSPPLDAPAHLTSRYPLTVRFCETDLMGVVHHANYLVYFEAGRVDWLLRRGMSYAAWVQRGIHLAVADARLRYRQPARFGDHLVVETTRGELHRASVRFACRILRGEEVLCQGEVLLAFLGPDLKLTRLPADLIAVLSSPETVPPGSGSASDG